MKMLDVCAAVLFQDGRVFLATRRPGSHLEGKWEFPGGKIEQGESPAQCILRELKEELFWSVGNPRELFRMVHSYPDRSVRLHFLLCDPCEGSTPSPREGQQCGWFTPEEAAALDLAPADRAALARIREFPGA